MCANGGPCRGSFPYDNQPKVDDMSNEQNLIPFDRLTESERREMAANAGRASGAARRRRRAFAELFNVALNLPSGDGKMTNAEAIVSSMIAAARNGDVRAFETIRDTVGERPETKVRTKNDLADGIAEQILGVKL